VPGRLTRLERVGAQADLAVAVQLDPAAFQLVGDDSADDVPGPAVGKALDGDPAKGTGSSAGDGLALARCRSSRPWATSR
jgi:hypothetical protein